jgi:nucleoid DNA-binding protein/nucleoid-associated protein YgaU
MNKRQTTHNLADVLAIQTGMDRKRAEKFIDALSSYMLQRIESDKFVKITGLGVFKIVQVRERESVHIHTGERFIIPAHHKISFVLDRTLKEQINRPFAFFEPIEVTENIHLITKKQPAGDEAESDPERERDAGGNIATVFYEDEDSLFIPEDLTPVVSDELPPVASASEDASEDGDVPDESAFISEDIPSVFDIVQPAVPGKSWYVADEDMPEPDDMEDDMDVVADETGAAYPEAAEEFSDSDESGNGEKTAKKRVVAPLWLWFLLLPFLIVAGVGSATYLFLHYNADTSYQRSMSPVDNESIIVAGDYDTDPSMPLYGDTVRMPEEDSAAGEWDDAPPDGETAGAATADSLANSEATGNTESQAKDKRPVDWLAPTNATPKPTAKSREKTTTAKPQTAPAGKTIPKRVRMSTGSSLTQIAMEHYGDKVFWVYIYDYNKNRIKDFNNIPVGMEIYLPQPNLYGINSKSRTSIQKARRKQSELLKWDKWDDYQ